MDPAILASPEFPVVHSRLFQSGVACVHACIFPIADRTQFKLTTATEGL